MRKVQVQCNSNMSLELDDMNVFQGELKHLPEENYQKFKNDVLELGISSAFDVWRNPEDDRWYLIDGHQRKTGLTRMRDKEGFEIPSLPCTVVHARDFREAKKKVLALTSQFGIMTKKGLHDFLVDNDLSLDEIDDFTVLPGIDKDEFAKEYFPDSMLVSEHERSGQAGADDRPKNLKLSERFLVPPFSVLDTRQGYWQDRKREWLALGIKSELGRGGGGITWGIAPNGSATR